jgi:hypothetical protein
MGNAKQPHRRPTLRFVVCIDNTDYPASLERHKIYRTVRDDRALKDGYLRVFDESGEDYLYSAQNFVAIELPKKLKALIKNGD